MRLFKELWLLNVYMLRLSCCRAFKGLECFQTETYQIFYFSTETIFLMYIYIHIIVLSIKSSRTSIFATFMNKYWRHIFCSFTLEKSECSSMDNITTCFLTSLFGKSYDAGAFPWSLVNCLVLVDDVLEGVVHLASDMGTLHLWKIPPVWCLLAPGNWCQPNQTKPWRQ